MIDLYAASIYNLNFLPAKTNCVQNAAAALQNIQQLNTFTEVSIVTKEISELDEEFLHSFSVILLNDCDEVRIKNYPSRLSHPSYMHSLPLYLHPKTARGIENQ